MSRRTCPGIVPSALPMNRSQPIPERDPASPRPPTSPPPCRPPPATSASPQDPWPAASPCKTPAPAPCLGHIPARRHRASRRHSPPPCLSGQPWARSPALRNQASHGVRRTFPPIGTVAVSRWSRTEPTHVGSIWRTGRLSPAAVQHLCCRFEVRPSSRPSVAGRLRVARNALPPPIAAITMASWASGL